jgi:FlaA1/EpsC-like NDP-sugar epimerase
MGEPVRILDLAKDLITLSGLKPYEDIDIKIMGIRPGEKLFEELNSSDEQLDTTRHPKIFIGNIARYPSDKVRRALAELRVIATSGNDEAARTYLNEFLFEANLKVSTDITPRERESVSRSYSVSDHVDLPA